MFEHILSKLNLFTAPANDVIQTRTRRSDIRREGMQVEVVIGRHAYPVHDWSRTGVSFATPDQSWNSGKVYFEETFTPQLREGDAVKLSLRFHMLHGTVEIPVDTRIARVEGGKTVAQLAPLSRHAGRKFEGVIDSFNAQRFLESQVTGGTKAGGGSYVDF